MKILKSHKVVGVRNLNAGTAAPAINSTNIEAESLNFPIDIEDSPHSHIESVVDVMSQQPDPIAQLHEKYKYEINILNEKMEVLYLEKSSLNDQVVIERNEQFSKERNRGYEEGLAEGLRQTEEIRASLSDLLRGFSETFNSSLIDMRPIVIELAFSAVTRIIGEQYFDEKYIKKIIDLNVKKLRLSDGIRITVGERDYNLLAENIAATEKDALFSMSNFTCSPSLESGGCVIETDAGGLDVRLDMQLLELKKILVAEFAK